MAEIKKCAPLCANCHRKVHKYLEWQEKLNRAMTERQRILENMSVCELRMMQDAGEVLPPRLRMKIEAEDRLKAQTDEKEKAKTP